MIVRDEEDTDLIVCDVCQQKYHPKCVDCDGDYSPLSQIGNLAKNYGAEQENLLEKSGDPMIFTE